MALGAAAVVEGAGAVVEGAAVVAWVVVGAVVVVVGALVVGVGVAGEEQEINRVRINTEIIATDKKTYNLFIISSSLKVISIP